MQKYQKTGFALPRPGENALFGPGAAAAPEYFCSFEAQNLRGLRRDRAARSLKNLRLPMIHLRKAASRDIPAMHRLLTDICRLHHEGRPDLFGEGQKYTDAELEVVLRHPERVVLVAADETDTAVGYAICILQATPHGGGRMAVRTLYLDDLCIAASARGQGVGRRLLEAAKDEARRLRCHNLTLNVWACNTGAQAFYEACGMAVQKVGMECLL